MATIVNFTSVTPFGSVVDQATNVAETASITLRVEPVIGNGVGGNGGSQREGARPFVNAMVDASGFVLPAYARLYKTSQLNGEEIAGTDVQLKLSSAGSAYRSSRPLERVYIDLIFTPETKLATLTGYAFDFTTALPAEWRPRQQVDYEYSLTYTAPTSGSSGLGIGISSAVVTPIN